VEKKGERRRDGKRRRLGGEGKREKRQGEDERVYVLYNTISSRVVFLFC
jgi:hypothetical protein